MKSLNHLIRIENSSGIIPMFNATRNKMESGNVAAIFYEYDYDVTNKTRRGILFLENFVKNPIYSSSIGFYPYTYLAFSTIEDLTSNAEYLAINKRTLPLFNFNSIIMLGNKEWVITDDEYMADEASLVTLIRANL